MAIDKLAQQRGRRKSVDQLRSDAQTYALKRVLGRANLVLLGIGCIIGAGIYVLTGHAAADFAGPAVMLSFVFAGLACTFAGLCYAELSSTLPVAGSAYTYAYATLGESAAWAAGWLMVLELGIAVALVAVGFSGYVASFLRDFGIVVPVELVTPFINAVATADGPLFSSGHGFNLVASLGVLAATVILIFGVSGSAMINGVIVIIKIAVLVAFVAVCCGKIDPANWTPFIPANEGGFAYGWPGVFRAASVIFFAYVGFETVATAAAEARNPQRDLPVGILGSLFVCTLLYIAVAAVLTGVVPYRQLGVPDPIAVAVNAMNMPWFASIVKLGAIAGLSSVMLAATYGQTRVFYTMSRDGLLPALFSTVHPRFLTPHKGTLVLGLIIALTAGLLPINILADLVSLGTATAFGIVCLSVMWLRSTHPELERPFRVPLGGVRVGRVWVGVVPVLGILFCLVMIGPLAGDIAGKALSGDPLPALLLLGYIGIGAAIYLLYGRRHSRLAGDQAQRGKELAADLA